MKFFIINFTLIALSNSLFLNWAYLYDVQDIPEPSHQLYFLYSKHQSQQPKNVSPNTSYPIQEIPAGEHEKNGLSISSQEYLHLMTVGIQCVYEYGLCLQLLSKFEHFHYRISESGYLDTFPERRPLIQDNGTLLPKQGGNLNYLLNVNCCGIVPFSKFKTFIETKVSAMKLQGFNL